MRSLAVAAAAVALTAEVVSAWQQHGSQAAAGRGRVRGATTPLGFGRGLRSMVTDEVSETEMRGTDAAPSTTTEEALDDWFNAMSTRNLVAPVSDMLNAKRAAGKPLRPKPTPPPPFPRGAPCPCPTSPPLVHQHTTRTLDMKAQSSCQRYHGRRVGWSRGGTLI